MGGATGQLCSGTEVTWEWKERALRRMMGMKGHFHPRCCQTICCLSNEADGEGYLLALRSKVQ